MHLQTIVHSVAFFGIENAAAPVSGQPRKIHSKARFGLQDESVQGIARGSLPLKASAAQAVAAFFTRVFYHTPGRLSSIFMREFEILCLLFRCTLKPCLFARGSPTRGAGAKRLRGCTKDSLPVSRSRAGKARLCSIFLCPSLEYRRKPSKREKIGFPLAKRGKTRYSIVTV